MWEVVVADRGHLLSRTGPPLAVAPRWMAGTQRQRATLVPRSSWQSTYIAGVREDQNEQWTPTVVVDRTSQFDESRHVTRRRTIMTLVQCLWSRRTFIAGGRNALYHAQR